MKIEGDCPHCKKNVAIDIDKLEVKQDSAPFIQNASTTGTTLMHSPNITAQIQPEKVVEKIKEVLPDYMPAGRCKNGNCDIGIHKNPNYKTRPKGKCTNCNQFSRHKEGDCPWCKDEDGKRGEIEEIDEDELDDLGIDKPLVDEHEGHNHE